METSSYANSLYYRDNLIISSRALVSIGWLDAN
jgi:hypothetical protein